MNGFQFEIILSAFKIFALDSFENRRSTPRLPLQSKKQQETYCAAFYASLSLLAGSSNNVSCNGGKNGGLIMRYAITLFRLFIYTWHFTVKKKMHPCLLRGYLANIFNGLLLNMHYVKRVCKKIVSSFIIYILIFTH